jgi:hypothetical protein
MTAGIRRWAAAGAFAFVFAAATAAAWAQAPASSAPAPQDSVTDQVRQLRDLVYKQQDQIGKQQEQINQLTQTNSGSGTTTITNDERQEILKLIKEELKDQKLPDWVSNLKITGDFRFRTEWTEKANTEANELSKPPVAQSREETRQRIRARLGFFDEVNDEVTVGFQLITGGGTKNYGGADPISGNQTLGGDGYPGEEKLPVWFDLAYADYHPKAVPGLDVYAGRIPNPFLEPGNSEMIWSSDLRLDGIAAKYKKQVAEGLTLFGNAGGFWVSEGVDAGGSTGTAVPDAMLWAAQGYATLALPQVAKGAYLTGGTSVYAYTHMQNVVNPTGLPTGGAIAPGLPFPAGNGGNSTNANGTLYSGFDIVNPFIEVGVEDPWLHKRIAVFGDFAYNAAAREHMIGGVNVHDDNNAYAWLIGTSYGTLKKPGDWQVAYNYRRVGADAVVGMFDDANAGGGGTDFYGSKLSAAYQIAKGWQAALSYYYDNISHADLYRESPSYQRLQFDLIFSF